MFSSGQKIDEPLITEARKLYGLLISRKVTQNNLLAVQFFRYHDCRHLEISRERKMSSDWPFLTRLRCKLQRGCYTQATCLATLRKVEGRSTFLATHNATIAVAKWGVTREFFLATCNTTFVALQVLRKIVSCNMAFTYSTL